MKVNQVCLLGSICMAIINFKIVMVRRQKEKGKHSKMFTVEIILLFKTVSHRLQALLYILHISQSEGRAFIII
jgi:heme/copper-type cytochrome/quinol oxidase subunit 4